MKRILAVLGTDIGRKMLMGITGLLMIGFLVTHMAANLLVIFDAGAYNRYSDTLISNPLIYLAELALVAFFVGHFVSGIAVTLRNRAARPVDYEVVARAGDTGRKGLASTTMIVSGVLLLVFVPLHILTFKFGTWYTTPDGDMRDLHRLVVEVFQDPMYVGWYLFVLPLLGFHAWHGFGSGFESLGIGYNRGLRRTGQALAVVLTLGFLAVPVFVLLGGGAS